MTQQNDKIKRICSGEHQASLLCRWYDMDERECKMPVEKRCALSVMVDK